MPRVKKQHLKRRKDGRYCCKYKGIQFMGQTEEESLQAREEYKIIERQEQAVMENPTVRQYAERWLPIVNAGLALSTQNLHKAAMRHLCDEIGNEYIRDVKPLQIRRVFSQRFLRYSESYIKHAKAVYGSLFDAAMDDGLITTNPVRSESAKPPKGAVHSHRAITPEERHLIETVALDHRASAAAITMLYAGLRPQEVKALRVEDVDFQAGIIHVRRFVHMNGYNKYTVSTVGKTKKATRDIPLFPPVRQALKGKKGLVIPTVKGTQITQKGFAAVWSSYCLAIEEHINGMSIQQYCAAVKRGARMPKWERFTVKPYDLRHSFATWCRDNGAELHTVVDWMGHTNANMILHIYDEASSERSAKEAEKLSKLFDSDA